MYSIVGLTTTMLNLHFSFSVYILVTQDSGDEPPFSPPWAYTMWDIIVDLPISLD